MRYLVISCIQMKAGLPQEKSVVYKHDECTSGIVYIRRYIKSSICPKAQIVPKPKRKRRRKRKERKVVLLKENVKPFRSRESLPSFHKMKVLQKEIVAIICNSLK